MTRSAPTRCPGIDNRPRAGDANEVLERQMLGYRVPAPDEAMLVSGGRYGRSGAPFKVVTGHGAFVLPFVRKTSFLTLSMCESEVSETCVTKQGISLNV